MKFNVFAVILLLLLSSSQITHAQNFQDFAPRSPESNTLIENIEVPIGMYTGTFSQSLPIYTIQQGDLNLPITLDYRGASKPNAEVASAAGLGWSLDNGGFLTRKVNGLPDEQAYGLLDTRTTFTYDEITAWFADEDMDMVEPNLLNGCYDTEPDEFYFNIGGITGTFSFTWDVNENIIVNCNQPIKIESYQYDNGAFMGGGIVEWIITSPLGHQYTFGDWEATHYQSVGLNISMCSPTGPHHGHEFVSSWYLTEIKDLAKPTDYISLNYQLNKYETDAYVLESASILDPTSTATCFAAYVGYNTGSVSHYNSVGDFQQTYNEIKTKSLALVTTSGGYETIDFEYTIDRQDINGFAKSLDEIIIKTNGQTKKSFELTYNHAWNRKLLLEKFQEVGNDGIKLPPYQFQYHNPITDADHAFSVDHWGFANGSTTQTNLPTYAFSNPLTGNGSLVIPGSDKRASLEGSKSYVMKKVIYPTGGYKEFEFELNTAANINGTPVTVDNAGGNFEYTQESGTFHCRSDEATGSFSDRSCDTYSFDIVYDDYEPEVDCGAITNLYFSGRIYADQLRHHFYVHDLENNIGYTYLFENLVDEDDITFEAPDGSYVEYQHSVELCLPPGTYYVDCNMRGLFTEDISSMNVGYSYEKVELGPTIDGAYNINIGGVRVSSVETYSQDNQLLDKVNYSYEDSIGLSTGVIYGLPKYHDPYIRIGWGVTTEMVGSGMTVSVVYTNDEMCEEWNVATSSRSVFGQTLGSHIGYQTVKEYRTGKGFTLNHYQSPASHPDLIQYVKPYSHPFTQHFKTGLLKKQEVFNETGDRVLSVENEYEYVEDQVPYIKTSYGNVSKIGPTQGVHGPHGFLGGDGGAAIEILWQLHPFDEKVAWSFRPLNFGYANLTKTITKSYDLTGGSELVDIVEYQYDPTYNNRISERKYRDVNGNFLHDNGIEESLFSEYKYVYDNYGGSTATQSYLTNLNMLSKPFRSTTQLTSSGKYINGSQIDNTIITLGGKTFVLPEYYYEVRDANTYKVSRTSNWNNEGRPGRITPYLLDGVTLDDNYTELIWSADLLENMIVYSPIGNQTTDYNYNALRLLEETVDHNGIAETYSYDGIQRLNSQSSNNGRITTDYQYHYQLDANGNLSGQQNEIVSTVSYNNEGLSSFSNQVSRTVFDEIGRELYTQKDNFAPDGSDVIVTTKTYNQYGELATEYQLGKGTNTFVYEASPLQRQIQIQSPIGTVDNTWGHNDRSLANNCTNHLGYSLNKVEVTDIDGNTLTTYSDFLGKKIKEIRYLKDINTGNLQYIVTDYCYDDFTQLASVYPPSGDPYLYTYNDRGLLASKQVPGVDSPTNYYYDQFGRQVLEIDANGNELVTSYDQLGRIVQEGLGASIAPTTSNNYYPEGALQAQTVTIQKNYRFNNNGDPIDWVDYEEFRNLETNQMLRTTYANYDDIGRIGRSIKENHIGGQEIEEYIYNAADKVDRRTLQHNVNNANFGENLTLQWTTLHDNNLRPTTLYFNDQANLFDPGQLLVQKEYNNSLQLQQRNLHATNPAASDFLQRIDYTYDETSRVRSINQLSNNTPNCTTGTTLCNQEVTITSDEIFTFSDIFYHEGVQISRISSGMNFPYTVNTSTDNGLTNDLQAWLLTNGYIINDVFYTIDQNGNLKITLEQTNFQINSIDNQQESFQFSRGNCCGSGDPTNNEDLFAQNIIYPTTGSSIARLEWATKCSPNQAYDFIHDDLTRLVNATYQSQNPGAANWTASNSYNMNVAYDLLGNVLKLNRRGVTLDAAGNVTNSSAVIDILNYSYNTTRGRLASVTDGGSNSHGFLNNTSYTYDPNGNIIGDSGKDLIIAYNHFNLPSNISNQSTNDEVIFTYLGDKSKVRKTLVTASSTTQQDYIGAVEYKDGVLEGIYHEDGRIRKDSNGNWVFEYTIKDHIGNARIMFADLDKDLTIDQSDIIQENHFYPFGMTMEGQWIPTQSPANQYQFNGKEMNNELGLDWMAYGFRFYDPQIARFTGVDPIADQYAYVSVYNYAENDPVTYQDLHGLQRGWLLEGLRQMFQGMLAVPSRVKLQTKTGQETRVKTKEIQGNGAKITSTQIEGRAVTTTTSVDIHSWMDRANTTNNEVTRGPEGFTTTVKVDQYAKTETQLVVDGPKTSQVVATNSTQTSVQKPDPTNTTTVELRSEVKTPTASPAVSATARAGAYTSTSCNSSGCSSQTGVQASVHVDTKVSPNVVKRTYAKIKAFIWE